MEGLSFYDIASDPQDVRQDMHGKITKLVNGHVYPHRLHCKQGLECKLLHFAQQGVMEDQILAHL